MPQKRNPSARLWTAPSVFAVAVCLLAGCGQGGTQDAVPLEQRCLVDAVGTLRLGTVPSCNAGDLLCRVKCLVGDAGSCLGMAYTAEKNRDTGAVSFYHRSCILGAANACTNYAAHVWAGEHSDEQLACARRTFEKACAAKEPYACGMVGRLMLEATAPVPYEEGRRYLEAACETFGGFPCRVLARHLESGKLGTYPPERVRTLLTRACSGSDTNACGNPKNAAETFE
jgi:TPR repeat protein